MLRKLDQKIKLELIRWISYWHQRENRREQTWELRKLMCSQNVSCGWVLLTTMCLIATTVSENETRYLPKNHIWLTKIFFRIFCTLIIVFLIHKLIKSSDLPVMLLFDTLLMQTDKFFLGQAGIHEGAIVPHLSVIPQYRSLPLLLHGAEQGCNTFTWFWYRVRQIC